MAEPRIPRKKHELRMLTAALSYLARGWNVIPVKPDKRPHLSSWEEYQKRRVTDQEVRDWWARWPDAGIAVLTGALSGVVVLDVDADNVEIDAKTLIATTGGGGKHYYFKHPGGSVPCAVRFLEGVDCRGDGGYVVVPPSKHKSGRRYAWDKREHIASMPRVLLDRLRAPHRRELPDEDAWLRPIPEGQRDDELTRRAGRLLRAGLTEKEVVGILRAVNAKSCRPPLEDSQVVKIARSIAGREASKREQPKARFAVLTQREMLRRYSEDQTRWTVEGWLPEASCGLLVAPPGNYKTWILAALGFSVATGRPFLGRWPVRGRGAVLFIQQEDPWGMLESRLARMFEQAEPTDGPNYELDCRHVRELDEMPVYWYTDRRLNFADRGVLEGMEQRIVELKPRLVMIDPLYTAVDSRDYMAEGAQRMTALKLMRDRHGCSFVIAHHTTVAGGSSTGRESIWGSQFLNAWLEFGWRIPEGSRLGNVIIRHFKGSEDSRRIRVRFRITDFGFRAEIDENYARPISERIEECILNGGRYETERMIADAIDCSPGAVHKAVKRMGLERDEEGCYRVPERKYRKQNT